MLVIIQVIPTASKRRKVAVTEASPKAVAFRREQMIQNTGAGPSRDFQQSYEPRDFNTALGNVAGSLVYAMITRLQDPRSTKLCPRVAGNAPDCGESHFVFAAECLGWARREGACGMRTTGIQG